MALRVASGRLKMHRLSYVKLFSYLVILGRPYSTFNWDVTPLFHLFEFLCFLYQRKKEADCSEHHQAKRDELPTLNLLLF